MTIRFFRKLRLQPQDKPFRPSLPPSFGGGLIPLHNPVPFSAGPPLYNASISMYNVLRGLKWWNGRHRGLKIPCREACGFESRFQHHRKSPEIQRFRAFYLPWEIALPFKLPLRGSFTLFEALNERFHTGGAGLLHRFRNVAVLVESESGCMVPEVLLHRLHSLSFFSVLKNHFPPFLRSR